MKEKFEAVYDWCCAHVNQTILFILGMVFLFWLGGMCSCANSEEEYLKQDAYANVAGIYVVSDGYQTIKDNQGTDQTSTFNLKDGLQLSVNQADNAISMLNCLGMLRKDLTVDSSYPFAQFYMGIEGCETVTCHAEFRGDTAYIFIHTDVMYSMLGFMGTSDIELELILDRTLDETDCAEDVVLEEPTT